MIETGSFVRKEEGVSSEDEPPSICMSNQTPGLNEEHVFQVPNTGWCAPAQLQMLHVVSGDTNKTQEEIAGTLMEDGKTLFDPNWGTNHKRLKEYLKKNWSVSETESNASWSRIEELLNEGYFVIANIMGLDNMEDGEVDKGGHYIRIKSYSKAENEVEIYDSSNGIRPDGKKGIYTLRAEFDPNDDPESVENLYALDHYFWDYATPEDEENGIQTFGWIAYADPLSLKISAKSQNLNAM